MQVKKQVRTRHGTTDWFKIGKGVQQGAYCHAAYLAHMQCAQSLSRVRLFATQWNIACQAPLSMGFSWQECWSGLPFPSPGDLPDPGTETMSPVSQVDSLPLRIIGAETYARPDSLNFQ